MGKVKRTRNNGTLTEAGYWSMVRSGLRKTFRYWKPIQQCKLDCRRKYEGDNKRQKWEHQCHHCKLWFKATEIEIDHIVPVGSLRCLEDLAGFVERLTTEDGFQALCSKCHQDKTNKERK